MSRVWVLVLLFAILPSSLANAGISFDDFIGMGEALSPYRFYALSQTTHDCIVATVVEEDERSCTNGLPPRPLLHVDEVLRGSSTTGRHRAIWLPTWYPDDGCTGYVDPLTQHKWADSPIEGPRLGEKLILLLEPPAGDTLRVSSLTRYPFTPERRKRALEVIARTEERSRDPAAWDARQESLAVELQRERRARRRTADVADLCRRSSCVYVAEITSIQPDEFGNIVGLNLVEILKTSGTGDSPSTLPDMHCWYTWLPDSTEMAGDVIFEPEKRSLLFLRDAPLNLFPPNYLPQPRYVLTDPDFGALPAEGEFLDAARRVCTVASRERGSPPPR